MSMFTRELRDNFEVYAKRLNVPDERQKNVLWQYTYLMEILEEAPRFKHVLEIGAGFSTVLLGQLAQKRGSRVHTLDADFDRLTTYNAQGYFSKVLQDGVVQRRGLSITADEFLNFYDRASLESYASFSVSELAKYLPHYIVDNSDKRKHQLIAHRLFDSSELPIKRLVERIQVDPAFLLRRVILDIYAADGNFENDRNFFINYPKADQGLLDEYISQWGNFDFVYFDCGEFSGVIEYLKLKDYFASGAIAAFHDIYFPKSYKNFLVCAAVEADPSWEILYRDESTPQGLLVVKKR